MPAAPYYAYVQCLGETRTCGATGNSAKEAGINGGDDTGWQWKKQIKKEMSGGWQRTQTEDIIRKPKKATSEGIIEGGEKRGLIKIRLRRLT